MFFNQLIRPTRNKVLFTLKMELVTISKTSTIHLLYRNVWLEDGGSKNHRNFDSIVYFYTLASPVNRLHSVTSSLLGTLQWVERTSLLPGRDSRKKQNGGGRQYSNRSRDSSVGIATATGWTAGVSFPGGGKRFFSIRQLPDRIWGPSSLIPTGKRGRGAGPRS
jgi:hypothetical protein